MKILHISMMPCAGAPYFWSECLRKYGGIESRCYSQLFAYPDGRVFPHDIEDLEEAQEFADGADVVVLHNWPPDNLTFDLRKGLFVAHSGPDRVHPLMNKLPLGVIAQHHPGFYKDKKFSLVPQLIDLERLKPSVRMGPVKVGYSPSVLVDFKKESGVRWHDNKGFTQTYATLGRLGQGGGVFTGLPWAELMEQAAGFDIWIDECVTGSYHRCSLQAAAMGQVPVNNAQGEAIDNLLRVTGATNHPFATVSLDNLETLLTEAVASPNMTRENGDAARLWMSRWWNPEKLIRDHFMPFFGRIGEKP